MAIIIETIDSRNGADELDSRRRTFTYLVQLEVVDEVMEDELAAIEAILEAKPDEYDGMAWRSLKIEHQDYGIVKVSLDYSTRTTTLTIDSSPATERIYASIENVARFGVEGSPAADFQGGINVSKQSVEGIDVLSEKQVITIVKQWAAADLTEEYLDDLDALVRHVNEEEFELDINGIVRTYAGGELRFDGWRLTRQSQDGDAEITYTLSVSRNADDLKIAGGTIGSEQNEDEDWVIPHKDGWDYLWIHFEEKTDSGSNTLVKTPDAAYIERVYPRGDFTKLAINDEGGGGGGG